MSFNVGEMVGPYRIIAQLGQGGMATVYKAYHAALDRYVALKVLHPAFNEDTNFLARFQREARVVAKLDHPNIVPIYDYAEHENRPYLVMKFIEGETLKARLVSGPIDNDEVVRIVEAVGNALQFAHKRGILHRDIKPSNVLLSNDGEIYLSDFGLARIAQAGESTLTSDMILGTPQYISPEQALGKKDLDEGTDIYSFGVMLYELAVGKVPFSADTPFSIIHDHIYSPLPMPRQINPTVSEDMERVLLKALAKERADRFKDVHGMVDAFRHAWTSSQPPVPVSGETVKVQPSVVPVVPLDTTIPAKKSSKRKEEKVKQKEISPAEPSAMPTKVIERKKKPWMWIASAVLMTICCVIAVVAWRTTPGLKFFRAQNTEVVIATPSAAAPSGELEQALQKVENNPDDPRARIQLVLAYIHERQPGQANQQIDKAISLGGEDRAFFLEAGAQLAAEESWLMSSRMYLRAAEIQSTDPYTDDMRTNLHEAIYKAFILPEARQVISYEAIGVVDKPLMYIARARYSFYNVDQTQGWSGLSDLETFKRDTIEIGLLRGEFYARSNKPRESRVALNTLLTSPKLPEWIKIEAQNILDTLPK